MVVGGDNVDEETDIRHPAGTRHLDIIAGVAVGVPGMFWRHHNETVTGKGFHQPDRLCIGAAGTVREHQQRVPA